MPPHTTKRRATNLKTKNNQNCQKIKLYGSPTTKELKKKHSSRPVGGAETGSWGREDSWQGGGWRSGRSHICKQINWNNCGETQTTQPRVPVQGKIKPQNLTVKTCGDCDGRINSKLHKGVCWRDPRIYTNPPSPESAPEEPNLLVGSEGSD